MEAAAKAAAAKKAEEAAHAEKARRSERAWRNRTPVVQEDQGVTYPIDVWFLIGDHIHPESVGTFARICKDSLLVTDSYMFWVRLYKRYFDPSVFLKKSLRPGTLKLQNGVRTRVIQALHCMYKPLAVKRETSLKHIDVLNREVTKHWKKLNRETNNWTYYICMKDIHFKRRPEWEGVLPEYDIQHNDDEGCLLLKVVCQRKMEVPDIEGYTLKKLKIFPRENEMFWMTCTFCQKKQDTLETLRVTVGPVIRVGFEDWWSPRYRPVGAPLSKSEVKQMATYWGLAFRSC